MVMMMMISHRGAVHVAVSCALCAKMVYSVTYLFTFTYLLTYWWMTVNCVQYLNC